MPRAMLTSSHSPHKDFVEKSLVRCCEEMKPMIGETDDAIKGYVAGFLDGARFAETFHKVYDLDEIKPPN